MNKFTLQAMKKLPDIFSSLRYITILYYLNDVEGGGETAFPVAENETLNFEVGDEFKTK